MSCKEFERLIPEFLSGRMDYQSLMQFSEHMEGCKDCEEELVIQFLVSEGMQRLEEGNAFDLQRELQERLNEAERKIRFHSGFLFVGVLLEILAAAGLIGVIIWFII